MSRVLMTILLASLIAGCAAPDMRIMGLEIQKHATDTVKWLSNEDETEHYGCCDEDFIVASPRTAWMVSATSAYGAEVRFVWKKAKPNRPSIDVSLIAADGWHKLQKIEVEIEGSLSPHRGEARYSRWEGNDIFSPPCIPPYCAVTKKLFRSTRGFPVDLEIARRMNDGDQVRVIIYSDVGKTVAYMQPKSDIGAARRNLKFWMDDVNSELRKIYSSDTLEGDV